jgi:hypothetical protein
MRFVVRVTETCPDGGIVSRMTWLAETEAEMRAMVDACGTKLSYMGTEVLPVTDPPMYCHDAIARCMPITDSGARQ